MEPGPAEVGGVGEQGLTVVIYGPLKIETTSKARFTLPG